MDKTIPPEARQKYRAKGLDDAALAAAALDAWDDVVLTGTVFEGPYHAFVRGYLAAWKDKK